MAYCKVCGKSEDSLFYASIKTYCKEHWKERVKANRVANIEHYRSFDKMRASMPHRVAARVAYQKTEEGKEAHKRANLNWASKYPNRRKASLMVGRAIRKGSISKNPCFVCGSLSVEAHHPDYSSPLDVVWLCVEHHKEIHWHLNDAD